MKSIETYKADLEQAFLNPKLYIETHFNSLRKKLDDLSTFEQVNATDRIHNLGKLRAKLEEFEKECLNKVPILEEFNKLLKKDAFEVIILNSQQKDQPRVYLREELYKIEEWLFMKRSIFFLSNAAPNCKYIQKDPISECEEQSNIKDETLVMVDRDGVNLMANLPNSTIRLFCIKDVYLNENSLSVLTK